MTESRVKDPTKKARRSQVRVRDLQQQRKRAYSQQAYGGSSEEPLLD